MGNRTSRDLVTAATAAIAVTCCLTSATEKSQRTKMALTFYRRCGHISEAIIASQMGLLTVAHGRSGVAPHKQLLPS